jgi:hypothetical protein
VFVSSVQALAGTVRADALTADLPTLMHWALDDMLPSLAVSLLQRTPSLAHAGLPDARDTVLGVAMARGVAVAEVTDMLQDMVMNRLEGTHLQPTGTALDVPSPKASQASAPTATSPLV